MSLLREVERLIDIIDNLQCEDEGCTEGQCQICVAKAAAKNKEGMI